MEFCHRRERERERESALTRSWRKSHNSINLFGHSTSRAWCDDTRDSLRLQVCRSTSISSCDSNVGLWYRRHIGSTNLRLASAVRVLAVTQGWQLGLGPSDTNLLARNRVQRPGNVHFGSSELSIKRHSRTCMGRNCHYDNDGVSSNDGFQNGTDCAKSCICNSSFSIIKD
jgi:hypothetical protein